MSNELSTTELLDEVPVRALLRAADAHRDAQRALAASLRTIKALPGLFRAMESLDVDVRIDLRTPSAPIEFHIAGDGHKFRAVWGELRRAGYATDRRPNAGDVSFSAFWNAAERLAREVEAAGVWMNYASTTCCRVQVGTRMVEQPIFETRCAGEPLLTVEGGDELVPL